MPLVIIIDSPADEYERYAKADMMRWWGGGKHSTDERGRITVDVGGSKFKLYEGVKRLKSFTIAAHVGRQPK